MFLTKCVECCEVEEGDPAWRVHVIEGVADKAKGHETEPVKAARVDSRLAQLLSYVCLVCLHIENLQAKVITCWFFGAVLHPTNIKQYQDAYRLVTVRTHGDVTVLPHYETRLPAPSLDIPLSHIILALSHLA